MYIIPSTNPALQLDDYTGVLKKKKIGQTSRTLVLPTGIESTSPGLEGRVLTTGMPGKEMGLKEAKKTP